MTNNGSIWWGEFELENGEALEREIAGLELRIESAAHELRISTVRRNGLNNASEPQPEVNRYVIGGPTRHLTLMPLTADRAVVAKPVKPLHVAAGGRVRLFVSTPLWYSVTVGQPPVRLQEQFVVRASDTWFGPSTMSGEMCYASRTAARLELSGVTPQPDRAVTAVDIHNDTANLLPLIRISLPAPRLALYADRSGMLWTQDVILANREEEGLADLTISQALPQSAQDPKLISPARVTGNRSLLFHAFGTMFS